MSDITQKEVDLLSTQVVGKMTGLRGSQTMQRIQLYVSDKTGMKFQAYFSGPASLQDKHALLMDLLGILNSGDFSKLPPAVQNQAAPQSPVAAAPVATPRPAPVPAPASNGTTPPPTDPAAAAIAKVKAAREAAEAAKRAAAEAAKQPAITEERIAEIAKAAADEAITAALAEYDEVIKKHIEARLAWAIEQLLVTP